jgi:N-glycosylase/DNA lyase
MKHRLSGPLAHAPARNRCWMLDTGYKITMKLVEIAAPDFDLAMTLDSGQVFHWEKIANGFVGAIADFAVYVEQDKDVLKAKIEGGTPARPGSRKLVLPVAELVQHYFALDHPLAAICASFPNDPAMSAARHFCRGLRIIRQPKWECLATFICSSMKQVAHIRQISLALRRRFGDRRKVGDHAVYTFPAAQRIARATDNDLRECALGYRAKNLLATARLVSSGERDLESWSALTDPDLRERLCSLPGVGAKIANCVMLFAYERLRAFPIDVWIERVLREKYFPRKGKATVQRLREFSETYFGEHRGYAQQYLFHYARTALRKSGGLGDSSTPKAFRDRNEKGRARIRPSVNGSKNKNKSRSRARSRDTRASCQCP